MGKKGWEIKHGFFKRSKMSDDILALCRRSKENFEFAYTEAGIDFWVKEN